MAGKRLETELGLQRREVNNMITRVSIMVIVLAVAVGLLASVQVVPTASAAMRHESYKGQITYYDEAGKHMVVSGIKGEMPFWVGDARIEGAIHLNEHVVVKYSDKRVNGEMVAYSVKVMEPRSEGMR